MTNSEKKKKNSEKLLKSWNRIKGKLRKLLILEKYCIHNRLIRCSYDVLKYFHKELEDSNGFKISEDPIMKDYEAFFKEYEKE